MPRNWNKFTLKPIKKHQINIFKNSTDYQTEYSSQYRNSEKKINNDAYKRCNERITNTKKMLQLFLKFQLPRAMNKKQKIKEEEEEEEEEYEEGDEERHRFDQFGAVHAQVGQQRLQQVGKGRLTDPAQAQRGQGDTQLAGWQVSVQLVVHFTQNVAAPAMLFGNGLHPGGAQLDHGELCSNEEAVEQHQQEGEDDHAEIGE